MSTFTDEQVSYAGVYYDIDKIPRLALNATHCQEAFQSTATTNILATYPVGFFGEFLYI